MDDWTKRAEKGIKYFSGTAVYTKSFDVAGIDSLTGKNANIYLDLGEVKCLARVKINNIDLGVIWTAPWNVKIPPHLLWAKNNHIVIEVTNVWANRLIGDEQEPSDCEWVPGAFSGSYLKAFPDWFVKNKPRPSAGRYCFTTWNYFTKNSPLVSSGLLGPVRIMKEDEN